VHAAITALRTSNGPSAPNWLAPYLLARCYLLQGEADAAESVLEAVPASARRFPSVALLKLEIQSELAGRSYAALVQLHPDSYRARMLKARTLGAKNHVDDAVREYRAALEARPGLPQVHLAIAQLYVDELNWTNAIEELNQELAVSPNNSLAMALLGRAYVQTGNETRAIPLLRKVIARYPDDAYALGDLGKALAATAQTKEAIEKFEAALSCDPSLYRLRYRLSELYRQTGHPDLARKQLVAFQAESARRKTQLPALE
jgi:predicted Zn-dependent protease